MPTKPKKPRIVYLPGKEGKGAVLSTDERFRYLLWRRWDRTKPQGLICGLNPSTADAELDDHTIRREVHYAAREWGWGGFLKVNLGALRATDPGELWTARDWEGPKQVDHLLRIVDLEHGPVDQLVVAWGSTDAPRKAELVRLMVGFFLAHELKPWCLGTTKAGHPRHPSRLPDGVPLVRFVPPVNLPSL